MVTIEKKVHCSFKIAPSALIQVDKIAKKNEVTRGQQIREIINEYLRCKNKSK